MNFRKTLIKAAVCAVATIGTAGAVSAAECPAGFPNGNLNLWVGYGAGGGTDLLSRSVASIIEKQQGWRVVVTNKPGAGSSVMLTQLKASAPDGLTIGATSTGAVSKTPNRKKDSPYTITDFTYLGTAQLTPVGMASSTKKPFTNWDEMMAYAKKEGRLTIATSAADSQYFVDAISKKEGINGVIIPVKGSAEGLQQVLGGHVDTLILGIGHIEQLKAGKMRQMMTFGSNRPRFAPDAETSVELGYDFAGAVSYVLLAAPVGVEPAVRVCLEQALDEAVKTEEFAAVVNSRENDPFNTGPEAITKILMRDFAFFKELYSK